MRHPVVTAIAMAIAIACGSWWPDFVYADTETVALIVKTGTPIQIGRAHV